MQDTINRKSKLYFHKHYLKKASLIIVLFHFMNTSAYAQLAVAKMFGKNSKNSQIGFGLIDFSSFPLNDIGNRRFMFGADLFIFPRKNSDIESIIGYLSIKVGYRYIYSEETKTGFYIEPSVGYCKLVYSEGEGVGKDGVAVALEGGYTCEVGRRGNDLNFGVHYETDIAGSAFTISSVGCRVAFAFHLFRRRDN